MNNIQKFKIVSEALDDVGPHPNVDMIIEKPFLFYYAKNEDIPTIEKQGIVDQENKGINAFFVRIPEIDRFSEFLSQHSPIKISVNKLARSSDSAKIVGINFKGHDNEQVPLKKEDLEKLAKKQTLISKFMNQIKSLEQAPYAKIYFKDGIIPTFTFKIIGREEKDDE